MVTIGQELAHYTITAKLDLPASASAYCARDAEGQVVTLYVKEGSAVSPDLFRRELERLKRLSRSLDGVVPVLDGGVFERWAWLATPGLEATPIERHLPRFRTIAVELVLGIVQTVSGGHALGWVHGDIGPHSVVVSSEGATLLRSFGFHRAFGAPADPAADAARYRAPEVFDGRPIDVRTDVYGLGMLLRSMLAGRRPPLAPQSGLFPRASSGRAMLPEGVPVWLGQVLGRALAGDPEERFQTVDELAAALESIS